MDSTYTSECHIASAIMTSLSVRVFGAKHLKQLRLKPAQYGGQKNAFKNFPTVDAYYPVETYILVNLSEQ
jgi:hypothetical protein